MSIVCPSVTPTVPDPAEYRRQLENVTSFAGRIQLDLMDGDFAPTRSIGPAQLWWPEGLMADIHLMFRRPIEHLETLISLKPNLVILHAEADGDIRAQLEHIAKFDIKIGVALLAETTVESARSIIETVDHVLIFSGDLGHFGGAADLSLLTKVAEIKAIQSDIEIGWDGGANLENVAQLAQGGIDVINVGGAIQMTPNPAGVYRQLCDLAMSGAGSGE